MNVKITKNGNAEDASQVGTNQRRKPNYDSKTCRRSLI